MDWLDALFIGVLIWLNIQLWINITVLVHKLVVRILSCQMIYNH
jgi:hypothetical protein